MTKTIQGLGQFYEFNPEFKLYLLGADKTIMSFAAIQCLPHIIDISTSNLVRNVDTFLSQKEVEVPVDCRLDWRLEKACNTKPI